MLQFAKQDMVDAGGLRSIPYAGRAATSGASLSGSALASALTAIAGC